MKFEIYQSENKGQYYFRLKAGNGQIILSSQGYSNKAGCKNGVESVQKHGEDDGNFERKEAANGKFHFNLKAGNGQIIGSSQMYAAMASMEKGIASVKRTAPQARVVDLSLEG